MLSTRILRTLSVCAVAAFAFVASRASAAPDISTPKKAGVAFAKAVESGDQDAIKATSSGSDDDYKNVQLMVDFVGSFKKFSAAIKKKFPDAPGLPAEIGGSISKEFEEAEEKIDGDTATLVMKNKPDDKNPPKLKKVDGGWKVDLSTISKDPDFAKIKEEAPKLIKAINEVVSNIEADKYKSPIEALQAFGEAMAKAGGDK